MMSNNLILNSSIEIALRLLVLLSESSNSISFQRLLYYDYALLHSNDFDPEQESLHPPSPFRKEALYVKNSLLKESLTLLCKKQLVDVDFQATGLFYKKNKLSDLFLNCLTSEYYDMTLEKAKWVNNFFKKYDDKKLEEYFNKIIGQWKCEFSVYGLTKRELVQNAK